MILASAGLPVARDGTLCRVGPGPMIGSRPFMGPSMDVATSSRAAWLALIAAVVLIAAATWLILTRGPESATAGAAVAGAGAALLVGGAIARRSSPAGWLPRWWFVESAIDRAFDGAVLGALAWVAREADPPLCGGALVGLGAGFLGAYVHARGTALGYEVDDWWVVKLLRYGLLAAGLLLGGLVWAVWGVAAVSIAATAARTARIARRERT